MFLKSALVAGFMATAMAATIGQRGEIFACGAPLPTEEHLNNTKRLAEREAHFNERRQVNSAPISVDAFAHVVYGSQSAAGGFLGEDAIKQQFQTINKHYASTGITFNLKGVDYEQNPSWAENQDEMAMKSKLRKGGYGDLNVYYLATLGDRADGLCYFPTNSYPGSQMNIIDGCTVVASTVPGATGSNGRIQQNDMVTTHEIGHWLGLMHTFEGGCGGQGDGIADTTPQAGPTRGCPMNNPPHSCGFAQPDPILNFMDYSSPPCAREFTPGQINRMKSAWQEFRQGRQGGGDNGGGGSPQPPNNPTNPGDGGNPGFPGFPGDGGNPGSPGDGGDPGSPGGNPGFPGFPGDGGNPGSPGGNPGFPGFPGDGGNPVSPGGNPGFPGFPGDGGNPGSPGGDPGFPGFPGDGGNPGSPGDGGNPGFPGGNPGFPGFPPFPEGQGDPGFPGGFPPFPINVETGADGSDDWFTWLTTWVRRRAFTSEKRADIPDEIAALRQTETAGSWQ